MKKSILLFLVLFVFSTYIGKAQTTCLTSQTVLADNYPFDLNINKTLQTSEETNWYKLPIYEDSIDVKLILSLDSFAFKAYKIEIFKGTCSSLSLLKVDSIGNANDTLLSITLNNLTISDSLYLKISTIDNNGCNACVFKTASYKLLVDYISSPQWDCLTCTTMTGCNLVCNGDFEQHIGLNNIYGNIFEACGWSSLNSDPTNNNDGTSDYFSSDGTASSPVQVPCNLFGYQAAHSGDSYAGFGSNPNIPNVGPYYEYIKTRLLEPLIPSTTYTISFWLSLAESSKRKLDKIGLFFYDILPTSVNTSTISIVNVTPQYEFNVTGVSQSGWTLCTAVVNTPNTQGLQYLMIGAYPTSNFTSINCATGTTSCALSDCQGWAYYFIDDISVEGPILNNQTTIQSCPGASAILTSTLPQPLNWANSNWTVFPVLANNQSIPVGAASTYYAYSTNNPLGCKQVEVFHVTHTLLPNQWITLTPDNPTICLGESITTTASGLTPGQYNWYTTPFFNYTPTSPSINNTPTFSFTPTTTTTLYVGGNAANGCRNFTETIITVVNPPEAIINTTDVTMCTNSQFSGVYVAAPQAAGATYTWAITINGVPHTDFTVSPNGQILTVQWRDFFDGANNAQICLTVSNGSCTRNTCIDVNKCCNAPRDQYVFQSEQPNYFSTNHINQNIIASGIFNSTASATLTNCNITFIEGSKIIENSNVILTFVNCHLNTCFGMWKGIEMMPACSLRVADCLVEDAETFAKANNNCGIDFFGNYINRCAIGLDLTNFNAGYAIVKGGAFTCRQNIPWHFLTGSNGSYLSYLNSLPLAILNTNNIGLNNRVSQYGIKTKNLNTGQLDILRSDQNHNNPERPLFDNQETGIYAENSGFKVYGTEFNKCGDNGTAQTYVQNNRGGIVIDKSPKYSTIPLMQIGDQTNFNLNYFVDCLNGIHCSGSENLNVLKNKFERIVQTAIYLQNGTALYTANIKNNKFVDSKNYGIHSFINNNIQANIYENRFEGLNTTNSINARAILLQEFSISNSSRFIVYNNDIREFKSSILAEQITNKSNFNDNQIIIKNDNTPFNFQFGIRLVNSNFTKIINNRILATASTIEPVRWWQYGIYNAYSPNTYIACNFISGPDVSLTCQGPTPVTIVNNTFKNPNFAGYWLHSNGISGPQGNSTTPSDNKWQYTGSIVNTYNPFQAFTNAGTNGTASPFYYRNQGQYILSYSVGETIFNPVPSIPIPTGSPYVMDSNSPPTQCSYMPTPTYRANINNNMAQKTIKALLNVNTNIEKTYYHARKALYNTLALDSIGTINDTVITNFKANASNYSMGKLLEADVLIKQGLETDDSTLFNQAEIVNNIISIESIEQNQKEVNEIFIRYVKNNYHFNQIDKQRLKQLAALCPETEGTAIFQARTLVRKFDNTSYYNQCELIDPTFTIFGSNRLSINHISELSANSSFAIFPNPAENEIYIESNNLKESDVIEVFIYSLIGKLAKKVDYTGIPIYKIDLSDFTNGTFIYKIKLNGEIIKLDKFIIIK